MEIAYIVRNCGRSEWREWILPQVRKVLRVTPDSTLENRRILQIDEGKVSIPFLYDPNTNTGMFESADILDYLKEQYS